MRVVTVEAIEPVLQVFNKFKDLRGPGPSRAFDRIAHIGPLKDMVLGFALQAYRICCRSALGNKRLCSVASGYLSSRMSHALPVSRIYCHPFLPWNLPRRPCPQLNVRKHPVMASCKVMFFCKTMPHHDLVPEWVRRSVRKLWFLITRRAVVCSFHECVILLFMTLPASLPRGICYRPCVRGRFFRWLSSPYGNLNNWSSRVFPSYEVLLSDHDSCNMIQLLLLFLFAQVSLQQSSHIAHLRLNNKQWS